MFKKMTDDDDDGDNYERQRRQLYRDVRYALSVLYAKYVSMCVCVQDNDTQREKDRRTAEKEKLRTAIENLAQSRKYL